MEAGRDRSTQCHTHELIQLSFPMSPDFAFRQDVAMSLWLA